MRAMMQKDSSRRASSDSTDPMKRFLSYLGAGFLWIALCALFACILFNFLTPQ